MQSSKKTITFSSTEARLLERSAKAHNMTVSELVRNAVVLWREYVGDCQTALEQWSAGLLAEHGEHARLTARVTDELALEVEIDGRQIPDLIARAVVDGDGQVQLWVCDPDSGVRVYLGRVRALSGAAIVVPIAALPVLGTAASVA